VYALGAYSIFLWIDPKAAISMNLAEYAARKLKMDITEVRSRYERLAEKYKLKLSWKAQ